MIDHSWIREAKCRETDPELFDLSSRHYSQDQRSDVARALCSGCPVVKECALDAMDPLAVGTVRAGIWIPMMPLGGARGRAMVRRLADVAGVRRG